MHSQQPPGVVQNWSTLQCSKQNTEQCGYDHAPVSRGRMRAQFPLPHGPRETVTWRPPPPPMGDRRALWGRLQGGEGRCCFQNFWNRVLLCPFEIRRVVPPPPLRMHGLV